MSQIDDAIIEMVSRQSLKHMMDNIVPQARQAGFTTEQIIKIVKRSAELAIKELNKQPH